MDIFPRHKAAAFPVIDRNVRRRVCLNENLVAFRPQKKEQKRLQAMLNDMEVGDSIVTTGGFYGVVIDMTEEDVIVEFGNNKNCRIPMRKQAIAEVEKAGSAAE